MTCQHKRGHQKQRTAPTGRVKFKSILCQTCWICGHIFPMSKISWVQREWVERFNRKVEEAAK